MRLDLSFGALRARYLDGTLTPVQLVTQLQAQIEAEEAALPRHVWIHRLSLAELTAHAAALEGRDIELTGDIPDKVTQLLEEVRKARHQDVLASGNDPSGITARSFEVPER
jgi:hypothetical protein